MAPKLEGKTYVKWSSRSKAYKLLKDGVISGEYNNLMKPKDIYESNPEYMKYSLAAFRAAVNRLKGKKGAHMGGENMRSDGESQKKHGITWLPISITCCLPLHSHKNSFLCCSLSVFTTGDKTSNEEVDEEEDEDDDEKENVSNDKRATKKGKFHHTGSSEDLGNNKQQWMPNHTMAVWENDRLRKMVTVVVVLDGGLDMEKDVKVSVDDEGRDLVIEQKLVDRVANVDKCHQFFRKKDSSAYPPFHPKIMAFQKHMKTLKKGECDDIYNTAKIRLPFQVQTDIFDEHRLGDKGGVRYLYVDLRSEKKEDFLQVANKEMIMVD